MRLEEPRWWREARGEGNLAATLLAPLGRLYGAVVEAHYRRRAPHRCSLPVICVGNFTAGGTGKTPLALLLIEHLKALGEAPVCLTRGYGGRRSGPLRVDPRLHTAADVGDEALLVARRAPVMVARDRAAGARAIESGAGRASVIVMDDGLQNPALAKDLSIAVVDGERGLGNGAVMPAGPLRAPLDFQLGLVDCIVVNGAPQDGGAAGGSILDRLKRGFPGPVLEAHAVPADDTGWLADAPVVAYAGIGNPARFFTLLKSLGARVAAEVRFPDHHVYTERDARELIARADALGALLVTTEKDMARLAGAAGLCAVLLKRSRVLPVRLALEERDRVRLNGLIEGALKARGRPPPSADAAS